MDENKMDENIAPENKKLNYKLIIKIGVLIIAVGVVIGSVNYVNSTPAAKKAISMATTQKPETFTELYFEDHLNLPSKIIPSKQYKFTFTIHNLENKDTDYSYIIYKYTAGQITSLDEGKISLKKDEYKTAEKTVGPFEALRTKIVVHLTDQNQDISFWMDK